MSPVQMRRPGGIKAETHRYFRKIGARITHLRKLHGYTQAELARLLSVSQQAVFAYELGDRRVSLPIVVKLAKIFTLSIDDLSNFAVLAFRAESETSIPTILDRVRTQLQEAGATARDTPTSIHQSCDFPSDRPNLGCCCELVAELLDSVASKLVVAAVLHARSPDIGVALDEQRRRLRRVQALDPAALGLPTSRATD